MSDIAKRTFAQSMNDSRGVFLNDLAAGTYTNTRLLPIAAFVHAEIQDEFAKRGIPILETTDGTFAYTALATSITVPAGIAPTFQAPLELWEQDPVASNLWMPMTRVARIPPPLPTNLPFLGIWEWANGVIVVLPCSVNRNIFCRYRIQGAYPTKPDVDLLGSEGFYWALVAGTAFYAAGETDRPSVVKMADSSYRKRTMDAIQIASRDRQALSFRQGSINSYRGRPWPIITNG